jgi:hypothetical protein
MGGPADGQSVTTARRSVLWGEVGDGFAPPVFSRYLLSATDEGYVFVYVGPAHDQGPDTP